MKIILYDLISSRHQAAWSNEVNSDAMSSIGGVDRFGSYVACKMHTATLPSRDTFSKPQNSAVD